MDYCNETLYKNKLFEAVYDGHLPERVPILFFGDNAFCLEYAGYNLKKEQYSITKNLEAIDHATADFDSDVCFGMFIRFPQIYKMLGAKNFLPGNDGFLQHPEIHGLEVDDYEDFIKDPVKTLWEKVLPRIYTALGTGGFEAQKALTKSFHTFFEIDRQVRSAFEDIANRYGKSVYQMAPFASPTPFDTLSDQLRSFSGISTDLRRHPDQVKRACEALLPLSVKAAIKPNSSRYIRTFVPLHMGPYMSEKKFKEFYWPTFKAYIEAMDAAGVGANIFVEQDWMRYLDYLNELPAGCLLTFEYGDAEIIKKKVGDRHIISGLFPLSMLKTHTKAQCIDKTKELFDTLAPDGHFIFSPDKNLLRLDDINPDNMKAVIAFAKEYGKY